MRIVTQNFQSGEMKVENVPPPVLRPDGLRVRNVASLISAGTERAAIAVAQAGPFGKAKARPDLLKKVLDKARTEGLWNTFQVVRNLLSTPLPLGYSCAGVVTEVGSRAAGFQAGDAVACAGLGYANHAEMVYVPAKLATKIPPQVSFEQASFVTLGAIALHGVRLASLTVGERVAVVGLGLVGQIAVQLAKAAGCLAFGIDVDPGRVALAQQLGASGGGSPKDTQLKSLIADFSQDWGVDAVIVCAATKSSGPMELAAEICRDRGSVVVVGDVGLEIPRRPYYEKEIAVRISRSYGPGRYDPTYEERGVDYPIGYVRWTENRNMSAFLELVAQQSISVQPLITHRFPISQAKEAYKLVTGERNELSLGIVLQYPETGEIAESIRLSEVKLREQTRSKLKQVNFGIIGAGTFARGVLLPALSRLPGVRIHGVATASGVTAKQVGDKHKAAVCTAHYQEILQSPEVDAILIATRHNLHASLAVEAMRAKKHVFVEKPLAMEMEGLTAVSEAVKSYQGVLMVGYNRRFSPLARWLKECLAQRPGPMTVIYRVNAGPVPRNNWTLDPTEGGGRIIGEMCHFIDFAQYLAGSDPVSVYAESLGNLPDSPQSCDILIATIKLSDGSVANIQYLANGDPSLPKEHVAIFRGGAVAELDNFRRASFTVNGRTERMHLWNQAKGHKEELATFVAALREALQPPIPFASLFATTATTFAVVESLREGKPVPVGGFHA